MGCETRKPRCDGKTLDKLDDAKLVALVLATGDGGAFTELVSRHERPLFSFLRSQGGDSSLAEEVAQRSLVKAYDKLFQFQGASSFRTWLFSIALRERQQLLRKHRSRARAEESLRSSCEEHTATDADLALDVNTGLARLTAIERNALLLCDLHSFTHPEAAEILKVPIGSLKTYVKRARQRMREFLSFAGQGETDE